MIFHIIENECESDSLLFDFYNINLQCDVTDSDSSIIIKYGSSNNWEINVLLDLLNLLVPSLGKMTTITTKSNWLQSAVEVKYGPFSTRHQIFLVAI